MLLCKSQWGEYLPLLCTDIVIEQANWDMSKMKSKLIRDLDEYIGSVRAAKLTELTTSYEVW